MNIEAEKARVYKTVQKILQKVPNKMNLINLYNFNYLKTRKTEQRTFHFINEIIYVITLI